MKPGYTADIGLEVHAELQTQSKMFCTCPVVDLTQAPPNSAACPVCAGMPGTLPVVNARAVEQALRVALALECTIAKTSRFARKNYFYPDLPKGYQISQYEAPLAEGGVLPVHSEEGWMNVRIRRVHLEEDTAKLTHVHTADGQAYSLVDLNRAGIPLLEIVSEPDLHTIDQVRAYTRDLRRLLQYLAVNSGDLEKGVIRFEANISVRPTGEPALGTRVEIKNLNSFRAMTAAIAFEIERQTAILEAGGSVLQETLGWDEFEGVTRSQRSKEEAHDYRYFPEPDLPPLVITPEQLSAAQADLPERPDRRIRRFLMEFDLDPYQAELLIGEKAIADYYETMLTHMDRPDPALVANWIIGELFGLMNTSGQSIGEIMVAPQGLADLLVRLQDSEINNPTAKTVLGRMFTTGEGLDEIIRSGNFTQVSDLATLAGVVDTILSAHPDELSAFRAGKTGLRSWFFGQVMQATGGQANPALVNQLLNEKL